jgi:hypothetical protein
MQLGGWLGNSGSITVSRGEGLTPHTSPWKRLRRAWIAGDRAAGDECSAGGWASDTRGTLTSVKPDATNLLPMAPVFMSYGVYDCLV